MSTGHIVVDGAMCKCKFGFAPDVLVVQSQTKGYINDSGGSKKLIANTMDLGMPFKAKTFGQCKLQPTSSSYLPCIPAITQWQDPYDNVILSNQGQILTENSKATCAIAGSPCVEFTWHGQTAAAGSSNIEEAEEEVQSHLNPLVNVARMVPAQDHDLETEEEQWTRNEEEKVVAVSCDLYFKSTEDLKTPYLDSKDKLLFESSQPFVKGLKAILGSDIKHPAIKEFMKHLNNGAATPPLWEVDNTLNEDEGGYYNDGKIHLNEQLILKAENDPEAAWLLFRVMIEETGHYVDDLLRNGYSGIGGDRKGDEGTIFAADFIVYNKLLFKDFEYAVFNIKGADGKIREFRAKVGEESPNKEEKARELLFVDDHNDDHGEVTLKSGEKVSVEFFKIRGMGAVHESITKQAAEKLGVKYDENLDEGCAWPDVPCGSDQNSVETCYTVFLSLEARLAVGTHSLINKNSLVYQSHYGKYQYWHSMCPTGSHTNGEVLDMIVRQAITWYKKAKSVQRHYVDKYKDSKYITGKPDPKGLFHIGKILHMVQDSYSASHVIRDVKDKKIVSFQSYNDQDGGKHGKADSVDPHKHEHGIKEAIDASEQIIRFYTMEGDCSEDLESYLRETVYVFANYKGIDHATKLAGGTHGDFIKKPKSKGIEDFLNQDFSKELDRWIDEQSN